MNKYYFVSYAMHKERHLGFGNIFVSVSSKWFSVSSVTEELEKRFDNKYRIAILNYKEVDEDTFLENCKAAF